MGVFNGDTGNNTVVGSTSDDTLYGYSGNDTLTGLGGNDTLLGGTDQDTLIGGAGADVFVFQHGDGLDVADQSGDDSNADTALLTGAVGYDLNWGRDGTDLLVGIEYDGGDRTLNEGSLRIAGHYDTGDGKNGLLYFESDLSSGNSFYTSNGSIARVYTPTGITGSNQGVYTEIVQGGGSSETLSGGGGTDGSLDGGYRDYVHGHGGDDLLLGSSSTKDHLRARRGGTDRRRQRHGAPDRLRGHAGRW